DQAVPAGPDLLRRHVDRLQAGGAEAVELHAATVSGRCAASAAVLAMSAPWSATGLTTPSTRSSIRSVSIAGLRLVSSSIRPTTSEIGLVPCRDPLLPRPRGVRIASYTNASVLMARLLLGPLLGGCCQEDHGRGTHSGPSRWRGPRLHAN